MNYAPKIRTARHADLTRLVHVACIGETWHITETLAEVTERRKLTDIQVQDIMQQVRRELLKIDYAD